MVISHVILEIVITHVCIVMNKWLKTCLIPHHILRTKYSAVVSNSSKFNHI